jgi:uncharacterized membrane protein
VKAPKAISTALVGFADRTAGVAKGLGFETVVWSALSALSLGLLAATLKNSEWIRGAVRPAATLKTVWPAVATMLAAVPAYGVVFGLLAWVRHRRHPGTVVEWMRTWSRRLALITGAPIVVALSAPIEDARPITTLGLCIAVGALSTYSTFFWSSRPASTETNARWRKVAPWLLGACALVYVVLMTRLAFINHWTFTTNRADLGFYMSVFRHSSLGSPLACTLCVGGTHSSGHFDPILVLLSPLYLLYPYSETLLLLQTIWLASSVIPVYLLVLRATESPRVALGIAASFLVYPALHGVNLFDFHSLALIIPLFLWLAYCFVTERWKGYWALFVLLLTCREDVSLVLVCVGVTILFSGKAKSGRIALVTMLTSAAYFVLVKKVFMTSSDPLNTGGGADSHAYYFSGLIPKGTSTAGLLGTVLTDPFLIISKVFDEPKVEYVLALLGPLMFLPMLGRGRLCLGYGAFLTLVATKPIASVNYHYSSLLIPFLFALCADAMGRIHRGHFLLGDIGRRLCGPLTVGILATTLLASWKFGGLVYNHSFKAGLRAQARELKPELLPRVQWLHAIARRLPRNAVIASTTPVVPHLGRLKNVYLIGQAPSPEYVIYGAGDKDARVRRFIEKAIETGHLVKVDALGTFALYRNTDRKKPWLSLSD